MIRPRAVWSIGMNYAARKTSNPLGPTLVPAGELAANSLRLRSWVTGDARQDSTTADLTFPVEHLVWRLSQVAVLATGDIVNAGTGRQRQGLRQA